eukprot:scaffold12720_cov152-Cylindrotheca_fusiformis.AAC.4
MDLFESTETKIPKDWTIPSKDRTLLLMRLNMAAYPFCLDKLKHGHGCSFSADTMNGLLAKGQSLYGSNISTLQDEQDAAQAVEVQNWNYLQDMGFVSTKRSLPKNTAEFDIGVSAMEWNIGNTTILTFRGTFSHGDYDNIEHWMMDYLLEKSTDRMKQAWVEDAGFEWTPDMQELLDSHHDDTLAKVEIRLVQDYKERTFPKDLERVMAENSTLRSSLDGGDLSKQDAKDTGYWKLTKFIVDEVYAETMSKNRTLVLTGHSQGGTRAQLASMYLQHTYGDDIQVPTVSFAATGAACMARRLFHTSGNLLQDVNPFVPHNQIVEYVHPLDPWGNAMLGQDAGGQVCYFGLVVGNKEEDKDDEMNHDPALEYCSKIYGWPGPILVANEHRPVPNVDLVHNFQRCRYFTHDSKAMFLALSLTLNDNGTTTNRGCEPLEPIPKNDPNNTCPTGNLSLEEKEYMIGFLAILIIGLVLLPLCLCCWCCKRRNRNRGYRLETYEEHGDAANLDEDDVDEPNYSDEEPDSIIELPTIS